MCAQAELAVQDKMKQSELLRAQEDLSSATKEKDRLVKRVKKLENVLKVVQATVPSLEAQKEQQQHNYRRAEDVVRKLQEVCHMCSLVDAQYQCADFIFEQPENDIFHAVCIAQVKIDATTCIHYALLSCSFPQQSLVSYTIAA